MEHSHEPLKKDKLERLSRAGAPDLVRSLEAECARLEKENARLEKERQALQEELLQLLEEQAILQRR